MNWHASLTCWLGGPEHFLVKWHGLTQLKAHLGELAWDKSTLNSYQRKNSMLNVND